MRIMMVAAENDALSGMKVGGMADVVRDAPHELAKKSHIVDVLVPSYGLFTEGVNCALSRRFEFTFAGTSQTAKLYQLPKSSDTPTLQQWVVDHPLFSEQGVGQVYSNDPPTRPFASDATKFACFCAAVATIIQQEFLPRPDVLHLHDWHTALLLVLGKYEPSFTQLKSIHTVYTVHNLSLQGIRPFKGDPSSLEAWFPNLKAEHQSISDPRYKDCINPMRAGILLADKVHLVSPTYAQEVLKASEPEQGVFGGEGLELELQEVNKTGNLVGILNGCDYPKASRTKNTVTLDGFYLNAQKAIQSWLAKTKFVRSIDFIADKRISQWRNSEFEGALVTSIGRLTDQKVLLLRQTYGASNVLEELLSQLAINGHRLILIGSGDEQIEQSFCVAMANHDNFLFINGYSDPLSHQLYTLGDLFLMPSSFEPCGISQMLAMRYGQPCLVHAVGGLKDTVFDKINGFTFEGTGLKAQSENLLNAINDTLSLFERDKKLWSKICKAAKASRYTWPENIDKYIEQLYKP